MVIEEIDRRSETVARMRDDKVEVTGHSTRSQYHQGHAPHEHRFEAKPAQLLDDFADCVEMIHRAGHVTSPRDRSRAADRRTWSGA
jgi:hypothetical protein